MQEVSILSSHNVVQTLSYVKFVPETFMYATVIDKVQLKLQKQTKKTQHI